MNDAASSIFRNAQSADERRLAARVWLTGAIQEAMAAGKDVAPAIALLTALEGLDFGHVYEMLRLPKRDPESKKSKRKPGGKEAPPAETGIYALALAAIDRLKDEMGVDGAIPLVAGELGMEVGALTSKRKHVEAERSRSPESRKRYVGLIDDYESERAAMANKSPDAVLHELAITARLLGRK